MKEVTISFLTAFNGDPATYKLTINKTANGFSGKLYNCYPKGYAVGFFDPDGVYFGDWFWNTKTFKFPSFVIGNTQYVFKKGMSMYTRNLIMAIKDVVSEMQKGAI